MEALMQELGTLTQGGIVLLFTVLVILDILTGYIKAFVTKTFSSREATNGLLRQVSRVSVFYGVTLILNVLVTQPTPTIDSLIFFIQGAFCIAYGRSLYENFVVVNAGFIEKKANVEEI